MFGINKDDFRGNPIGVDDCYPRLPGVARIRATPGCKTKPLWGLGDGINRMVLLRRMEAAL